MASRKRAATPARRNAKRVDDREAVEVLCRLRPYDGTDGCTSILDCEHVMLTPPTSACQRNGQSPQQTTYKFSYVFDESDDQMEVFQKAGLDLVENLIRGRNSLLFTYGVTGSGKTYTMNGGNNDETAGVLPRILEVIFKSLPNRADKCVFAPDGRNGFEVREEFDAALARRRVGVQNENRPNEAKLFRGHKRVHGANMDMLCAIFVSYIEVYNDVCYDLLDDLITNRDGNRVMASKDLRLGVNNIMYVDNVTEVEVDSREEALDLFLKGQEKRRVGDTLLNKQSSRSHSIFNIRMVAAPSRADLDYPESDPNRIHVSQLSLVDLAGSERSKRTRNEGVRLVESGKINQSLLVLRQCFEKLRENQRGVGAQSQVPYRESKITHLFKNFFEGSGKVRMIICVNPKPEDYAENLGVMSFAELSQSIEVVTNDGFVMPVTDGFPISRSEYRKWTNEIEPYIAKPASMSLFPAPPSLELSGPNDVAAIARIRTHYQNVLQIRASLQEQLEEKEKSFEAMLRRALCVVDVLTLRLKEVEDERDEMDRELCRVTGQLRKSKRENQALSKRIARYEAEENEKANVEEEQRRREELRQEKLQKSEKTLHQIRELFENPPPRARGKRTISAESVNTMGCSTSNENIPHSAIKPSLKNVAMATPGRNIYPPLNEQEGCSHVSRRMGPNVAARTGFYNSRHTRRSKSANSRVIDHQPRNRIPEGRYFKADLPRETKSTTKVEMADLKKSCEYVLTHQEVDTEGNLTTQLVKGKCIPTAGGGTAVQFTDVERLSQESPSNKP
ncbi:unnamed protein product [Enterobius vermicularis]|uniref:Kinesin-like protein n=1 Tax=Enterobius vermicularis TaxID=51028 RepID=A0A0N4V5W3_ENTVE|nr:unnamed protein product [Enterobius vermicularis]